MDEADAEATLRDGRNRSTFNVEVEVAARHRDPHLNKKRKVTSTFRAPSVEKKTKKVDDTNDQLPQYATGEEIVQSKADKPRPSRIRTRANRTSPPVVKIYTPFPNEQEENENLEIVGEEPPEDGEGDLPCRLLDNFVLYNTSKGNCMVSLEQIGEEGFDITASGDVEPIFADGIHPEDDDDDDDDDVEDNDEDDQGSDTRERTPEDTADGKGKKSDLLIKRGKRRSTPIQRIRLSAIFYFQEQYLDSGFSTIWLRTTFAWYKLCRPLPIYERYYLPIFMPIRITNLVIAWGLVNTTTSVQQFLDNLPELSVLGVQTGAGGSGGSLHGQDTLDPSKSYQSRRDFHPPCQAQMVTRYIEFICAEFEAWCEQCGDFELIETPIMKWLYKQRSLTQADDDEDFQFSAADGLDGNEYDFGLDENRPSRPVPSNRRVRQTNRPKVTRAENPATVTPHISNIAKGLFKKNIVAVKPRDSDGPAMILNTSANVHPLRWDELTSNDVDTVDTRSTRPANRPDTDFADMSLFVNKPSWLRFTDQGTQDGHTGRHYHSLICVQFGPPDAGADGDIVSSEESDPETPFRMSFEPQSIRRPTVEQQVRLRDCVYVTKRVDKDRNRDTAGEITRIVQVCFMFYDKFSRRKLFHGRVLEYGRETVLSEVAGPHELFLTDECETFDFATDFRGLCPVYYCSPEETNQTLVAKFGRYDGFFYRFWHDHRTGAFEDVELHDVPASKWPDLSGFCPACRKRRFERAWDVPRWFFSRGISAPKQVVKEGSQTRGGNAEKSMDACLTICGEDYHLGDFVYIIPDQPNTPYRVCQIVGFSPENAWENMRDFNKFTTETKESAALEFPVKKNGTAENSTAVINFNNDSDDDEFPSAFAVVIPSTKNPVLAQQTGVFAISNDGSRGPAKPRVAKGKLRVREFIRMDDVPLTQIPESSSTFVSMYPYMHHRKRPMLASEQGHAETLDGTPSQTTLNQLRRSDSASSFSSHFAVEETHEADNTCMLRIPVRDTRHLYATQEFFNVSPAQLEGKCWVEHVSRIPDLESYKANDSNAFYVEFEDVTLPTRSHKKHIYQFRPLVSESFTQCQACYSRHSERLLRKQQLVTVVTNPPGAEGIQLTNPAGDSIPPQLCQQKPLVALDIFSGCGGLTAGMEACGLVHTKYAVEFMPSAALTFERNYPSATVYNQCANLLLARAIMEHVDGQTPPPAEDFMGRPLASMPPPGAVGFIYCGPPCQGFSGINRFPKADDIKNTLVTTSLSYVDFYRPRFFLLENVQGMVHFKLGGEQSGSTKIIGGIKMGVIKFIVRALTSMGYQTRFSVQQAANHGVPQSRRRLFIWGARRGEPLPVFPQPTTCFHGARALALKLPRNQAYLTNKRTNGAAPHSKVSIQDAICDLPAFEYLNPQIKYPLPERSVMDLHHTALQATGVLAETGGKPDVVDPSEECELSEESTPESANSYPWLSPYLQLLLRLNFVSISGSVADKAREAIVDDFLHKYRMLKQKQTDSSADATEPILLKPMDRSILQWPVPKTGYVGVMDQPFQCPPLTQYQRDRRRQARRLANHVTRPFLELTVERICRIPMTPGADHQNLPEKLKPWCLSAAESAADRHNGWRGLFGRLDFHGHFLTALTEINPMNKAGTVIHPTQHRVLSVRECARSQGFPDHFVFLSDNPGTIKDMHRQIGNAVPPLLAHALSSQLLEGILERLLAKGAQFGDDIPTGPSLRTHPEYLFGITSSPFSSPTLACL
ncbi:hypothetical protein IWQ61_007957 [Dispira simplex]|nr:hypothetical protein IWQ61_007957 [Dispira simplex]